MELTPIKVRGKRKKPMPKLLSRGRPLKSQANSSASTTDVEGDNNATIPRKRRKTRHARRLAPLESLPAEILQNIFWHSRNADLMFASKAVMQKLEKSEHVKLEFVFSTLFWPIINGEVDPDINSRPDMRHASADEDDDLSSESSLLAHAQSRLLSCRFFTEQWFHRYILKAYDKWNTLHAASQPDRVVKKIYEPCWGERSLLLERPEPTFRWITQRPDLLPDELRGYYPRRTEEEKAQRDRLAPLALHPAASMPLKFFRPSRYFPRTADAIETRPDGSRFLADFYDILGFLYYGLRLRIPVRGDDFDDLVRGALRGGSAYLCQLLLFMRIDEVGVTPFPADLLRIAVLEDTCTKDVMGFILRAKGANEVFIQDIDLLDPAIWAWADKNGEQGEWLKAQLRNAMNDD
ncbi:uncharacterized protein J3D65DRAFT_410012 [Phyllosticta citribraziliensis]|uniref:F-box domain-containing protein n=1 Tax=Phyllosticta citribraziliensis TaxID=989973 RepID=A0ABR1LM22_9PEZI